MSTIPLEPDRPGVAGVMDRSSLTQPWPLSLSPVAGKRTPGILVVDDDALSLNLLNDALERYGFDVWLAQNGVQALQVFRAHRSRIDLVLMDVRMPGGLDGPQTLSALQRICPQIRCCFMTADFGLYTEDELLERGALHVFAKPYRIREMGPILKQLIEADESVRTTDRPAPVD